MLDNWPPPVNVAGFKVAVVPGVPPPVKGEDRSIRTGIKAATAAGDVDSRNDARGVDRGGCSRISHPWHYR